MPDVCRCSLRRLIFALASVRCCDAMRPPASKTPNLKSTEHGAGDNSLCPPALHVCPWYFISIPHTAHFSESLMSQLGRSAHVGFERIAHFGYCRHYSVTDVMRVVRVGAVELDGAVKCSKENALISLHFAAG